MEIVFKICPAAEWALAEATGVFAGSAIDHADGFIHLSASTQVRETAARHFAGCHGLVLVALAAADLENLQWEPSRGGALFPHVHGHIPAQAMLWVRPLPLVHGTHVFPGEVAA